MGQCNTHSYGKLQSVGHPQRAVSEARWVSRPLTAAGQWQARRLHHGPLRLTDKVDVLAPPCHVVLARRVDMDHPAHRRVAFSLRCAKELFCLGFQEGCGEESWLTVDLANREKASEAVVKAPAAVDGARRRRGVGDDLRAWCAVRRGRAQQQPEAARRWRGVVAQPPGEAAGRVALENGCVLRKGALRKQRGKQQSTPITLLPAGPPQTRYTGGSEFS